MERLTWEDYNGGCYAQDILQQDYDTATVFTGEPIYRLAAYERTEHTPEECAAAFEELAAYKATGFTPDDFDKLCREMSKLRMSVGIGTYDGLYRAAELLELEQNGTLLKMPYPVGSYVFVSPNKGKSFHKARIFGKNEKGTYLVWVCDESLDENEKHIVENPMTKFFYDWFHKVYSKEEAEAALKEQESNDGN